MPTCSGWRPTLLRTGSSNDIAARSSGTWLSWAHARTSPSPERTLHSAQKLAVIQEAIQELPAKCRTAFLLRKVHQYSTKETGERMGLTGRMVRLYVARALAHCTDRLQLAMREQRNNWHARLRGLEMTKRHKQAAEWLIWLDDLDLLGRSDASLGGME